MDEVHQVPSQYIGKDENGDRKNGTREQRDRRNPCGQAVLAPTGGRLEEEASAGSDRQKYEKALSSTQPGR
jgi:hypothetical protein